MMGDPATSLTGCRWPEEGAARALCRVNTDPEVYARKPTRVFRSGASWHGPVRAGGRPLSGEWLCVFDSNPVLNTIVVPG